MGHWARIDAAISEATGLSFRSRKHEPVAGGCIHHAAVVASDRARYFVKRNLAECRWMFRAEAAGLQALAECGAVTVPRPVCEGVAGDEAYLVMEYLPLCVTTAVSAADLGARLAVLHGQAQPAFGFVMDNAIGATPQPNPRCHNWPEFLRRHRIGFQLTLARENGLGSKAMQDKGARLCEGLDGFFSNYAPAPSLLHGDLWSGNVAALDDGTAVMFDPASYWGDREADVAMTELFGGFPADFYQAYGQALPLDPGYPVRRTLYNLYHVLNHANLFGGGYAGQAERMMDALLAELR